MNDRKKEAVRECVARLREQRRAYAINKLGGCCAHCGSTADLEFDHKDPLTKVDGIANLWTSRIEVLDAELVKCQLLCRACHRVKTEANGDIPVKPVTYIDLICAFCSEPFQRPAKNYRWKAAQGQRNFFCSRSHQVRHRNSAGV